MDHATSAGAGAGLTALLWLPALNPYLQLILTVISILWIARQFYRSFKDK